MSGRQASAIAIITRWRMPPESWCGYSSTRRSAPECPPRAASRWRARAPAPREGPDAGARFRRSGRRRVNTGFSEVIGSWKIIEMRLPRTSRMRASAGLQQILVLEPDRGPQLMRPGGVGISRSSASAVMLLPQPDSPTTPSVSPADGSGSPRHSAPAPRRVACGTRHCRSSTFSKGVSSLRHQRSLSFGLRASFKPSPIRLIGQHGDEDRRAGERHRPPARQHITATGTDHQAPAHRVRVAQAEERQAGLEQDGDADGQCGRTINGGSALGRITIQISRALPAPDGALGTHELQAAQPS